MNKQMYQSQKGQVIILNLMFLVMTILVLSAFIPMIKITLDNMRNQDQLNCKSDNTCPGTGSPCYNASLESETTSCLVLDLYIPYIILIVLVLGVGKLMAQKAVDYYAPQQGYQ